MFTAVSIISAGQTNEKDEVVFSGVERRSVPNPLLLEDPAVLVVSKRATNERRMVKARFSDIVSRRPAASSRTPERQVLGTPAWSPGKVAATRLCRLR